MLKFALVGAGSKVARTRFRPAAEALGFELVPYEKASAVYVATPPSSHAHYVMEALRAGKHVLCEKPLARSLSEAEALFELADRYGLFLAENWPVLHHPQWDVVKFAVANVSGPLALTAEFGAPIPVEGWRARMVELGALGDFAVYGMASAIACTRSGAWVVEKVGFETTPAWALSSLSLLLRSTEGGHVADIFGYYGEPFRSELRLEWGGGGLGKSPQSV